MYLKSRVKLPDVHGKLTRLRRGDITYIKYEYGRYYDPEKKYTYPQRATIGKVCPDDDTMMIPNEAFLKYFPDAVLSGMEDRTERSSCLRVGTYAVMHKIVLDYSLDKLLGQFFSERDMALLLDLASAPGGFNLEEAKAMGRNAHLLLGLPGKCAPLSSAEKMMSFIFQRIKISS